MIEAVCFLMYQQARGLRGVYNAEQEHMEAVSPSVLSRVVMRSLRISVSFSFSSSSSSSSSSLNFPD